MEGWGGRGGMAFFSTLSSSRECGCSGSWNKKRRASVRLVCVGLCFPPLSELFNVQEEWGVAYEGYKRTK